MGRAHGNLRKFGNIQGDYLVCGVALSAFIYSGVLSFSARAGTWGYSSRCSLDMFSVVISVATPGGKFEFDTNMIIVANANILHDTFD